jgi:precorrin-6B methylase 2
VTLRSLAIGPSETAVDAGRGGGAQTSSSMLTAHVEGAIAVDASNTY